MGKSVTKKNNILSRMKRVPFSLKTAAILGGLTAVAGKNFYNTGTKSSKYIDELSKEYFKGISDAKDEKARIGYYTKFMEDYKGAKRGYPGFTEAEKYVEDLKTSASPSTTASTTASITGSTPAKGLFFGGKRFGISKKDMAIGVANAAMLSGLGLMAYKYPSRARNRNFHDRFIEKGDSKFFDYYSGLGRPYSSRRLALFNIAAYGKKRKRSTVKRRKTRKSTKKVRRRRSRK